MVTLYLSLGAFRTLGDGIIIKKSIVEGSWFQALLLAGLVEICMSVLSAVCTHSHSPRVAFPHSLGGCSWPERSSCEEAMVVESWTSSC